MKEKTKRILKDVAPILVVSALAGVALQIALKRSYHKGTIDGVNRLLAEGTLKWTDNHPVVVAGKLISGDPNWVGASVLNGIERGHVPAKVLERVVSDRTLNAILTK